jgi:hypothetical protein
MLSEVFQMRTLFRLLLAVALLLPLAAELRLCIASDHLEVAVVDACCDDGDAEGVQALASAASSACDECLDVRLPEQQELARVQHAPTLAARVHLVLRTVEPLTLAAPAPAVTQACAPPALLPVASGTLLRI